MSSGVASFHLVRERPWRGPLALARLATDRPRLAGVPGLRFHRRLGTGRGSTTSLSVDPRRTALFAVWEHEDALDAFLAGSPIASRCERAEEWFTVRLRGLGGHGTWCGFDVLGAVRAGDPNGRVAVLTRAGVRLSRWPAFLRAGPAVSHALAAAPGLLAAAGIGEAPVGRQATFSLWATMAAMEAFAHRDEHHREVVRRTRAERWYGEELFARFEPYAAEGTWSGRNPLSSPG